MSDVLQRVGEHSEIEISFKLSLNDGTLVDEATAEQPYRFVIGDGSMLPNLESLLIGLELGTKGQFYIGPEDGFGFADPSNIHTLAKQDFPDGLQYEEGDIIGFDTPTGDEIPGRVIELHGDQVKVDFNHPLAGHTIIFEAKIEKIIS